MEEPAPSQQRSRGTRPQPIEIVAYDPAWPERFVELGRTLRGGLGEVALRIDHIGSTAVPGLAAKPIIDIQVSVAAFEPLEAFRVPLERLGYVYRADSSERTKRYFREPPGRRRTHVHVRRAGSFSEQWALLFRDYPTRPPRRSGRVGDGEANPGHPLPGRPTRLHRGEGAAAVGDHPPGRRVGPSSGMAAWTQ
jgi:GrpB-like predicted nucleotidyltransferase (UPF0157 family)